MSPYLGSISIALSKSATLSSTRPALKSSIPLVTSTDGSLPLYPSRRHSLSPTSQPSPPPAAPTEEAADAATASESTAGSRPLLDVRSRDKAGEASVDTTISMPATLCLDGSPKHPGEGGR
eukprot:CAMPEP_0174945092 /NCGR_PEP_ID=MMETSP1355-20121228/80699_1 /TAXON_ID=464990 /ORGANISM="Hemiselmis tepida, Strain CCMP443" /LENGTH=120 /DNA_ID=CAMNT_0016192447 /DNA_START=198 /DNA_END=557 /DNA_ORIENTATION=-